MLSLLIKTKIQQLTSALLAKQKKKRGPAFKVLMALLFVYTFGAFCLLSYITFQALCEPLHAIGADWFYFAMMIISSLGLMFITNIFTAQSQIYGAKDNELLLSMPIKPRDILLSRMFIMLLLNLVFELVLCIPAIIVYMQAIGLSMAGWLAFAVIMLIIPFLGLALSLVVGYIVQLVSVRIKKKSLITSLLLMVFFAGYFYVMFQVQNSISVLVAFGVEMADSARAVMPLIWMGEAISKGNLLFLALTVLICILPFILVFVLLNHSFIKLATDKRSGPKTEYKEKSLKTRSGIYALYKKDMSRFLSMPAYIFNGGLGILFLLFASGYLVYSKNDIALIIAQMPEFAGILPAIAVLAICFCLSMVIITAPSISIEGKYLWIIKSLPISHKKILLAKALPQIVLSVPCCLIASTVSAIVLGGSTLDIIGLYLAPLAYAIFCAFFGLLANLKFPKFDWTNEVYAIKQGASTVISMFGTMAIEVVFVLPFFFLLGFIAPSIYILTVGLIIVALDVLMYRAISTWGVKVFDSLQSD